ncbi:Gfo/Idh/MocA family protein [Aquihabitans daechungensis]|uniref:Gfo/Idh/MocA family protein n=1 Tax=Aquihabitans daechungensis TaxID=1052257 RepID=UPI003BA368DA
MDGPGSENPVCVAVIGCGAWGKNHVRTHAAIGSLAAVVDPVPAVAEAHAATYGVDARTFDQVLADDTIDGVVIAAPAADHARLAEAALAAGKHVFVEKPLALTVDDAEHVVAAAAAADRILMVGHLLQYHPAFLALRDLVASGRLGDLRYLYSNRLNLGQFRQEENSLWSFAPHDLSMLLSLVGEEPDQVWATGAAYLSTDVADVTTTHLGFPSGPRAHVFVSWLHPFKEQRLVVVGSEAMAVFDDLHDWPEKLVLFDHGVDWSQGRPRPEKADGVPVALDQTEPLRVECEHFLSCIETGATPRTDGAEGLRVLRVLARAQDSLGPTERAATGSPA